MANCVLSKALHYKLPPWLPDDQPLVHVLGWATSAPLPPPTPLPFTPRNVPDPDPTQFMSLTPAYSMTLVPSQHHWPLAHSPDTPYACPWPIVHSLLICWSRPLPLSFRSEHVPQMKPTINGHHHYISTSNEVEGRKKGKNVVGCKIPFFLSLWTEVKIGQFCHVVVDNGIRVNEGSAWAWVLVYTWMYVGCAG